MSKLKTKVVWSKYPSVLIGGKPYFWVCYIKENKYTVVWNRINQKWMVCYWDKNIVFDEFDTDVEGKKFVEQSF
jgi:hypothetical protein